MRGLSAQLALCLLLGAVVACTASVDSKTWFPENPSLEFIPGKTAIAVLGARNLGKTEVNISAAWAQIALVSNAEGSIYNFSAQAYSLPGLSTNEETILEYPLPMPINLPPRDFILRIIMWTTSGPNEHTPVVVFNETISIAEESKLIDTELLGLYVILLAFFAAAAYGLFTFAQGKGWVKKPRKTKAAPVAASIDNADWLKGTVADKSKKAAKQS